MAKGFRATDSLITKGFRATGTTVADSISTRAFKASGDINAVGKLKLGTITFPNRDSTSGLVLTTNGSGVVSWATATGSGVPYTGATGAVNLGAYDLSVNGMTVGHGAKTGSGIIFSNTAIGDSVLQNNAYSVGMVSNFGYANTGVGQLALQSNTSGGYNTGVGQVALQSNTSGGYNTAVGAQSLSLNTSGYNNTAVGAQSLWNNTTGSNNTASGYEALYINITGSNNTAYGNYSLLYNTWGVNNTANGFYSLAYNQTGHSNTASGYYSLVNNTNGNNNTAAGDSTLKTNTTGFNNTAVGFNADVSSAALSNATAIGNGAIVRASNTIQLGNASIDSVVTKGKLKLGAITLPNIDGTANQVLTTNGSGVVSWMMPAGVSSVAAIGGSSTAYGASISGSALSFTPADGTNGGIVTNAAQTFAGKKTFADSAVAKGFRATDSLITKGFRATGNVRASSANVDGQAGIGTATPNASAKLDVSSTVQGFLPPRMTGAQRDSIASPAQGLILYCTNCGTNGEPEYYNGTAWVNLLGTTTAAAIVPIFVGSAYQGGTVAYILVSGDSGFVAGQTHGLIESNQDVSAVIQWCNGCTSTNGTSVATGTAIGSGLANTNAIITSQGAPATNYAAGVARAYTGGGYADWYLPSKDELSKFRLISGASYIYYWTSSQSDSNSSYYMAWMGGLYSQICTKNLTCHVRAVRTF